MRLLVLIISFFACTLSIAQSQFEGLIIGKADSIIFDQQHASDLKFQDSLREWNGDSIQIFRTSNPYLLQLTVRKGLSNISKNQQIIVRIWFHEDPKFYLKLNEHYVFYIQQPATDSVFQCVRYCEAFRPFLQTWAIPVSSTNRYIVDSKKALFHYKVLRENDTRYYRIIKQGSYVLNDCD
jgi:hypothetical protein